ncbi:topoisomerase IV [Glaciecola sp. 1036]|uniref:topoisomerase IV n=1 Tax=Alteromonadaceae TaxID=72275 RepID=UPI003D04AE9A
MMKNKLLFPLSLIALSLSPVAEANSVRINGFANFTAGISSEESEALGYSDKADFSEQSLFAVQLSGQINDKMSATAQIVSKGNNGYSADFEWAYIKYDIDSEQSILAGRFRLPIFRYSSSLDVGYSYHWISAPSTVYDVPFNNLDGVRYDYSSFVGDWELMFQASLGNFKEEVSGGSSDGSNVITASFEATYESFKMRFVYGQGDNNFHLPQLDASLDQFAALSPELAEELRMNDDRGVFLGAGFEYDNFDWFVSGEITSIDIEDSFSPEDKAWYITAGIRSGKWTPHFTYETRDGNADIKFLESVAAFPAEYQPVVAGTLTAIQMPFMEEYSVTTVGARYDFDSNIAIKAEISRYDNELDAGVGIRGASEDSTIVRASVNYVF